MQQGALDNLWVLVSACLVFFMHAGFALVECGLCRRKNAAMVLLKNVGVVALSSLTFYAVGFAFMFGGGNALIGLEAFWPGPETGVAGAPDNLALYVFLFFQLVFAATAATIVSGAVAERVSVLPFFIFTALATSVLYPIAGHWVWGGGWLAERGFHDFAGSTVVHAAGGAMALAGVFLIGPRIGRYDSEGRSRPMPAHNLPLAALGVLVLWLGWFGFNGGSTLSADAAAVGAIVLVTNLAGAAGFLAALLQVRARTGALDLSVALNGALAGLVGITAGADVIGPAGAMIVGALAGVLVVEAVLLMDRWQLDDPVGAIPVHLCAGVFGTLAVGVFAEKDGLLFGGGWVLLGTQALGAGAVVLFAAGGAALCWLGLGATTGVRVSPEHEEEGLDRAECGLHAYDDALSDAIRSHDFAAPSAQLRSA